jgi:hypothetical protein
VKIFACLANPHLDLKQIDFFSNYVRSMKPYARPKKTLRSFDRSAKTKNFDLCEYQFDYDGANRITDAVYTGTGQHTMNGLSQKLLT